MSNQPYNPEDFDVEVLTPAERLENLKRQVKSDQTRSQYELMVQQLDDAEYSEYLSQHK